MRRSRILACVAALVLAMALPTVAFADDSSIETYNGQGAGGWFDGEGYKGVDPDGKAFEIHAGILPNTAYQIKVTDKAPSNWPANADNALGTFFSISRGSAQVSGQVYVGIEFDISYDGRPLVYYIENADGTTETVKGFVSDCQYLISSIVEDFDKAEGSLIGVAFASEPVGEFADVDGSTPHADDISWLASSEITTGFPDGSFKPMADVARCDMAAFLYRLAGYPEYTIADADLAKFKDVDEDTPHAKEIFWLASVGITTGFPDGTFRPYNSIARCDMAAFLHRADDFIKGV